MSMSYYILEADGSIRMTTDAGEWGRFYEDFERRRIGDDEVDELRVSTVFLGLDHNWGFADPTPILFETMVFGMDANASPGAGDACWRYHTRAAAVAGHERVVAAVREFGAAALFDLEVEP